MKLRAIMIAIGLALACHCSTLVAQVPDDYLERIGVPDFSVNDPVEMGAINVANGNLHLEIPLASLTQRSKAPFRLNLVYDSQIYGIPFGNVWRPNAMIGSLGGWRVITSNNEDIGSGCFLFNGFPDGPCPGVNYGTSETGCNIAPGVTGTYTTFSGFSYLDANGLSKSFPMYTYNSPSPSIDCIADTPNASAYADDGSGYLMVVTGYNQAVVYDNYGNQITAAEDSNGNIYGHNANGVIDFVGRNPVLKTVQGNLIYLDVLNSQGGRSRYTLTTTNISVHTAFGPSFMTEYTGSLTVIQSVKLPNNTSYTFDYDSGTASGNYGLLKSITLPSGAVVQYGYTTFVDSQCSRSRWVSSRNSQGNVSSYTPSVVALRFGVCPIPTPAPQMVDGVHQVTATKPDQSSIVYTFTVRDQSGAWMTSAISRDPAGNALQTVTKDYMPPIATRLYPLRLTTSLPVNGSTLSKKVEYSWSLPNLTEIREWDFYTGTASAAAARITDATYTSSNAAYVGVNILSKPTGITITDGSGNIAAQRTFEYDNYTSGIGTSGAVQHDSAFGPGFLLRGNLTATQRWRNTDGVWLVTRNQFDDAGNITSTTDPGSHKTTISYTDAWDNAGCAPVGGNAAAYATAITNAKNQSQTATYNSCSGTAAKATDLNNSASKFTYDPMDRLLTATASDLGQATFTYSEASLPINTIKTVQIDAAHSLTQTTVYDDLGRLSQTQLTSDPSGTDLQLTKYDSLGRKKQVFNPTRCNPPDTNCGEPTWGYISFDYDGLGRVKTETAQDGGVTTYAFKGNSTTITDQAGKQRRSVVDGFGRLIEVDEPPVGGVQVNYHATMQTGGSFVLSNAANGAVWSTGTNGTNAQSIFMQDDGNLVLYIFKWQAGVYAAPSPGPFTPQSCSISSYLIAGQRINPNQCIVSPHGQYMLYMAPYGNLYIYDIAHSVGTWGTNTNSTGAYATLQTDGNFVVYSTSGVALWNSGTSGTFAERLDMEDDGRIIIYKSAWNSGTSDGQYNGTTYVHPGCDVGIGTGSTGVLGSGQCFVSPNGRFELLMQGDGNLVIYDRSVTPNTALWSSGTAISPVDPSVAMRTLYTYDILGNLTCVEQHGTAPTGTGCPSTPPGPTDPPIQPDPINPWRRRLFAYNSLSQLRWASNPESGVTTYSYDADGNLLQKTSPAPNQTGSLTQTVSYCYETLHRLTGKAYSAQTCTNGLLPTGTAVASYFYDQTSFNGLTIANGIGRRTGMSDQAGAEAWSYDAMGRVAADRRTISGVTKTTSYLYNFMGNPTSITFPSGSTIVYTYNNADQMLSTTDAANSISYATLAGYAPTGDMTSLTNNTNVISKLYYNSRLQPCRIFVGTGTSAPANCADNSVVGNLLDFAYGFNLGVGDNGNVVSIANNRDATRSQSFAYDALNRIASAQTVSTAGTNCFGEQFGYDAWGNMLTIGGITGYSGCTQENLGVAATNKNQIGTSPYDAAGNLITAGYTYDAENHLLAAGGITYTYDGDGKRVQKSSGKLYWYGMGANTMDETDLTGSTTNSAFNEYVYFSGKRIARRGLSNTAFYYFADHLGTSRVIAQAGQTTPCYDADFYPFGGERTPIVGTCNQNYKFIGKERDSETGLDLMAARFYSSGSGRFAKPDPLVIQKQKLIDPQQWNMYQYARNNPLRYTDPTGEYICADSPMKCDSKKDKAFEKARQEDLRSKDAAIVRGAKAFGAPNTANGTTVKFGDPGKGRDGNTTTGGLRQDPDHPGTFQAEVTVTIRNDASGTALEAVIAHEGTHLADAQAFVATISSDLLHYDYSKNLTQYQTEVNAFRATQGVQASANEKASYGECTGGPCIFGPGVRNVDEVINQLLANPANNYNLTPDHQGQHQFPDVPPLKDDRKE
jgi:RHS repeat-associated protein